MPGPIAAATNVVQSFINLGKMVSSLASGQAASMKKATAPVAFGLASFAATVQQAGLALQSLSQVADSFRNKPDTAAAVSSGSSSWQASTKPLVEALKTVADKLKPLADSFKSSSASGPSNLSNLSNLFKLFSSGGAEGAAGAGAGQAAGVAGAAGAGEVAGAAGLAGAAGPVGVAVLAIGQAFGQLVGAVKQVVDSLWQFVNTVKPFVDALQPGTVMVFDQELRNLTATIGTAFVPVIEGTTNVLRNLGDILIKPMQELAPIMKSLTDFLGGIFLSATRLIASLFHYLAPVLQAVVDIFAGLGSILNPLIEAVRLLVQLFTFMFSILAAVFRPVIDAFKIFGAIMDGTGQYLQVLNNIFQALTDSISGTINAFWGTIKLITDAIARAFKNLAEVTIVLVVSFAKMMGTFGETFITNLKKIFEQTRQIAAPTDSRIQSFEQIANEITTAAFVASGQDTPQDATLKDIAELIQQVRDGTNTRYRELTSAIEDIGKKFDTFFEVARFLRDPGSYVLDQGIDALRRSFGGS